MLVEQGTAQRFDGSVAFQAPCVGCAVLDAFQLQSGVLLHVMNR
jgi:hypothetical protein